MNLKLFNLALILRLIPVTIWGIGYAPDSKLFLSLSEAFDYSHNIGYPLVLSVLDPAGAVSFQIILDSLTAVMIASLSPIGGVLYAVSLGPIVYSNYVLTDTFATFALSTALLGALRDELVLMVGGLLCAIFLREISLLLSPIFIFWWWNEYKSSR